MGIMSRFVKPKEKPDATEPEVRAAVWGAVQKLNGKKRIKSSHLITVFANSLFSAIEHLPQLEDRKKIVRELVDKLPEVIHEGDAKSPVG